MRTLSIILWLGIAPSLWSQADDPFADATPQPQAQDNDPFADSGPQPKANDPFVKDGDPVGKPRTDNAHQNNVGFFTEFIEIDPLALTEMLSDEDIAIANGSVVRDVVEGHLTSGKAKLLDSCFLSTSGGKAKLHTSAEFIYPVEWDQGETFHGSGEDRREVVPKVIDGVTYWPPTIYPHPTTFEMRPVGTFLDATATVGPSGATVQAEMAPELILFAGRTEYGDPREKGKETLGQWLPVFSTARSASVSTVAFGNCGLISTSGGSEDKPLMMFSHPLRLQRAKKPTSPQHDLGVTVIAEFLEVDALWFRQSIDRGDASVDSVKLRAEVQELIAAKKARVTGIVFAKGMLGQEMRSEGVGERIYATEYDPPEIPSANDLNDALAWPPASFPVATAFQTRNMGMTIRATVNDLGQGHGFEIKARAEFVRDGGDLPTSELDTPSGRVPMTQMPLFISTYVDTTVVAHPGEIALVGALTPRDKDLKPILEKRWLAFLRLAK